MIGQGLKILLLVTTNEPVKSFHEAVARPGRCASQITFNTFDKNQATQWLKNKGVKYDEIKVKESMTIAELYGLAEGFNETKIKRNAPSFGFSNR